MRTLRALQHLWEAERVSFYGREISLRHLHASILLSAIPFAGILAVLLLWSLNNPAAPSYVRSAGSHVLPKMPIVSRHADWIEKSLSVVPLEDQASSKRIPRYLLSIFSIFIIPDILLMPLVWRRLNKKALLAAMAAISLIGWAWSWNVTFHDWWTFKSNCMLGVNFLSHLFFEEILFYPFGGALCILLYLSADSINPFRNAKNSAAYLAFVLLGTAVFAATAWATRANGPYYLLSQLFTYNILCCLLLAAFVRKEINLAALCAPILLVGAAGFIWDFFAIKHGVWRYNAVTGITVLNVPIEEFNFYLFAPTSAAAIYLSGLKLFAAKGTQTTQGREIRNLPTGFKTRIGSPA